MRFRWRTAGWLAATVVATYVLLPQIGRLGRTGAALRDAQWPWLGAALAMSAATYAAAALALMGACPCRLAFGRTVRVQLATSFANLMLPYGLGATAVDERYLERSGLTPATAVATVAVTVSTGILLHILELAGVGVLLGTTGRLFSAGLPGFRGVLIGAGAAIAITGLIVVVVRRRPDLFHEVGSALRSTLELLRRPRRAAIVVGGQLGVNLAYVAALGCALQAFGQNVSPLPLAAAYLAGSALGAAGPTPAGLGVVEASLVAGLAVVGVPAAPAVAGVLAFRLVTFWLPAGIGFVYFRSLKRNDIL
ncbi:lysylphosphatidylglycerol synthase transmembrane domain-containing protein [Nocardia speluncae]|uniref:lysylphosphatidylglycerol synthase transmembrane domain-containing protein n=1 Tax=Nocardia speluncae TaxID=419477 RepID=UPI001FDFBD26|nr:lysylphosphatidylglycerol synthase transmembrane domain-containing protein [Nocardia speluncae]